jgi:sortase A
MTAERNIRLVWSAPESDQAPHADQAETLASTGARPRGLGGTKNPSRLLPSSATDNSITLVASTPSSEANRPYSTPRLPSYPPGPLTARRRNRSSNGGGGLSIRKLAAIAILIAGLVIIAQALFIPLKAQAAQFLMSRAWSTQIATGEPTRPWPWADFTPQAKLSFPSQGREVLALSDAAGESLAFGPTLMAASAAPGENGVAVFAAHRDTHFAFLNRLQPGQLVNVDTGAKKLSFKVIGSSVVRWDNSAIHPHDGGAPRIALVTCWPLDSKFHGPMRYVVWAEMIAPEEAA